MRITELKARPVVDRATARTLGRVVDVFVNATGSRIFALEVASPGREDCVRIPAEWITRIGSYAVMVARRPGGQLDEVIPATAHCLNYQSLVGLEVLDESGERVGHVQDARVDAARLTITSFELVRTGWRGWLNLRSEIQPNEVASCSRDLMMLRGRRMDLNRDQVA